jgi:hypothetical protein
MGKSSKLRSCPATGGSLTPAECGDGRGSRFACPADCPHNPFGPANYSQLLEIEKALDRKSLEWLFADPGRRPALEQEIGAARRSKSPHAFNAKVVWLFLFQRDALGLTPAQRWERAGFPGLCNDERVAMRWRMQMRVSLMEVRRVLDAERTEAVDLLEPQPALRLIYDRGLAAVAVRFAPFVVWTMPMPHFWCVFGTATVFTDLDVFEPWEAVDELVRHLGGPADKPGQRQWLAEHYARFDEALSAVTAARRRLMFESLDAKVGRAVYELRRPFAACRETLDQIAEVDHDDLSDAEVNEGFAEARVWFDPKTRLPFTAAPPPRPVLGRVLLGQSHWRLETIGAEKLAGFRQQFESQLGSRVRFVGERVDDLRGHLAEKGSSVDDALVPPRLLEQPQRIVISSSRTPQPIPPRSKQQLEAEWFAALDRAWLDDSIPTLGGKTPREAVRDPALRPRLIRMMKSRIRGCDERNLKQGTNYDVNWLVRELGLDEILVDPPPRRPRPASEIGEGADGLEPEPRTADRAPVVRPGGPPAPDLPPGAFTADEVGRRLDEAMAAFDTSTEALDEMAASGCTLVGELAELTEGLLSDDAFPILIPFLIQVWYVFVPRGTSGPELDPQRLRAGIRLELETLLKVSTRRSLSDFRAHLASGPQPALSEVLAGMIIDCVEKLPKKLQPDANVTVILIAVLRAVVAELDRACRSR